MFLYQTDRFTTQNLRSLSLKPKIYVMNLPSIYNVLKDLLSIIKRFPIAVFASAGGTIAAIILVGEDDLFYKENYHLLNLIFTTSLMLPAFISVQLFLESQNMSVKFRALIKLVILSVFTLYFFSLPQKLTPYDLIFFALINIALHLLVAFSPFIGKDQENDFWEFNKTLFLQILTALLYSGVLYTGLFLALLAVENLFDVNVQDTIYARLWFFMAGIFNTLFFLGGVPVLSANKSRSYSYPKGLKVFTQYVLLPLVAIYLAILYTYMAKIGGQWYWPKGWVSYLVLGFSGLGILSFLLLRPLQGTKGNKWVGLFLKWFYFLLIPLVILLGLAVFRRVYDYGITENRYFLIVLTFWLMSITLYFLISSRKGIKIIPISLCIIAFLSAFGPWGAIKVAQRSQLYRFENVLHQNNMLKDGLLLKVNKKEISFEDQKQLSSIIRFLESRNQLESIKHYFPQVSDSLFNKKKLVVNNKAILLAEHIGIDYTYDWETQPYREASKNISLSAKNDTNWDISQYDYLVFLNYRNDMDSLAMKYDTLYTLFNEKKNTLEIFENNEHIGMLELSPHLRLWIEKYPTRLVELPSRELSVENQNETHRFRLNLDHISLERREDSTIVYSMGGMLLIGEK